MAIERNFSYGTGRRKKSVARVRVYPGNGKFLVNNRELDDYFGLDTLVRVARQPLVETGTEGRFDVICNVHGGGLSGQAGAVHHGLSRALVEEDGERFKASLKSAGFLTRDSRMKERKKYGLRKARKAGQYSKR